MIVGQFILCSALIVLAVFFGVEFFVRYNLDYNEVGRYFDEESVVVYDEQGLPVFGFLFAFFLFALVLSVRWIIKTLLKKSRRQTSKSRGNSGPSNEEMFRG